MDTTLGISETSWFVLFLEFATYDRFAVVLINGGYEVEGVHTTYEYFFTLFFFFTLFR